MSSWSAEEDAAFRAAVDREVAPLHAVKSKPERGSWDPIELAAIVAGIQAGEIVGPVPSVMVRSDGVCLLYRGETHQLAGEPESGKGLISLAAAAQQLATGENVLMIDFEDSPASIVTRLLALGATPEAIIDRFTYIRPVDPLDAAQFYALTHSREFSLAIIDGVSEAFALLGLDLADNLDAAKFLATLPRPLAETGAAVLLIDHVAKAKESRGRYALGAGHKLAGVAAAFSTDVIKAPSRADAGMIKIKVEKDRHGHVRGQAAGGVIALAHITPSDNGEHVTVSLDPPEVSVTETGDFRPTTLMERVSRYLEDEPGATLRTVRTDVAGKAAYVDQALRVLVAEGFVQQRPDGQARRHYVVNEYREDDVRVPVSQPCPDRVPDTGETYRVPVSLPLQGDTDTGHGQDQNSPTVSRDTPAS
jgi:hypothetical protein